MHSCADPFLDFDEAEEKEIRKLAKAIKAHEVFNSQSRSSNKYAQTVHQICGNPLRENNSEVVQRFIHRYVSTRIPNASFKWIFGDDLSTLLERKSPSVAILLRCCQIVDRNFFWPVEFK